MLMSYGGHFDISSKKETIKVLQEKMADAHFWDDKNESETIINELNELRNCTKAVDELLSQINDNILMIKMSKEDKSAYEELKDLLNNNFNHLDQIYKELKVSLLLNGKHDKNNAIFEIHSGAGGTEACDWANMLYRMYTRYFENKNYKSELLDLQPGEEVGIKSVTMIIKGNNAYGYLKSEKGVHRLIRLSPFDSNNKRHTSFASVDVTPLFENTDNNIEIKESDLKIDVYRSSGCGGQGVNTTDSAVRITHLPTKIVVTCQNERSQIQNKATALEILKNKLLNLEIEKQNNEIKDMKKGNMEINFGSQIRSYTLHPYSLVKDHRTNTETSNVNSVLDGDLDMFINNYLLLNKE